jgi:hypothetical protein
MLTIRKTVDIPADRRLSFELPQSVPKGQTTVLLTLIDAASPLTTAIDEFQRQAAEKTARRKAEGKKPFEGLRGSLKDSKAFAGDPADIVKKWRDEWTSP